MPNLEDALRFTLAWEGGYNLVPGDSGGATNYGITQGIYDSWRAGQNLPKQGVENLTLLGATTIYDTLYWTASRAKWMAVPLSLVVFDTAVNFGVGGAITRLAQALGLGPTTVWTDEISAKVHDADPAAIAARIVQLRIAHRYNRVSQKPSQKVFLQGWLNRDCALAREMQKSVSVGAFMDGEPGDSPFETMMVPKDPEFYL